MNHFWKTNKRRRKEFVLWILYLFSAELLILFPVHLKYEYNPIESISIFNNSLPFFAVLYFIFLSSFFLLILSKRKNLSLYTGVVLIVIFMIVFLDFRIFKNHLGLIGDGWYNKAHVELILSKGKFPSDSPEFGYFQFPALHIFAASLFAISGFQNYPLLEVLLSILLTVFIYLLYSKWLNQNQFLALLGSLLVIHGSDALYANNFFFPTNFGLLLLMILMFMREISEKWEGRLLCILIFTSLVMTHFISSLNFLFILLGLLLINMFMRLKFIEPVLLPISLIIFLAWQLWLAEINFRNIVYIGSQIIEELAGTREYAWIILEKNLVPLPYWAQVIRIFWIIFIYGLGGILVAQRFFKIKNTSNLEIKNMGVLIGIICMGILVIAVSGKGFEFLRGLAYVPFFIIPFIVRYLNLRDLRFKTLTICLILILLFSFPTFLVRNSRVCLYSTYPSEVSVANFFKQNIRGIPSIYTSSGSAYLFKTYLLDSRIKSEGDVYTQQSLEENLAKLINDFQNDGLGNEIFLYSPRFIVGYQHLLGLDPQDPKWNKLLSKLENSNCIFSNGFVKIFHP